MTEYYVERSEDYLQHHGVKGMKWGKWNAETAARYAGKSLTGRNLVGGSVLDNATDRAKKKMEYMEREKENWSLVGQYLGDTAFYAGSSQVARAIEDLGIHPDTPLDKVKKFIKNSKNHGKAASLIKDIANQGKYVRILEKNIETGRRTVSIENPNKGETIIKRYYDKNKWIPDRYK